MPKKDFEEVHLTVRIVKPKGLTEMDVRKGVALALKSVYNQGTVSSPIRGLRHMSVISYTKIGLHSGKE